MRKEEEEELLLNPDEEEAEKKNVQETTSPRTADQSANQNRKSTASMDEFCYLAWFDFFLETLTRYLLFRGESSRLSFLPG